jgi:fatty-acid desaturase
LPNFLEWIGERAARDGAAKADARSQRLHHRAVETVGDAADAHILRVRGLHLVLLEWLHLDNAMLGWATKMALVCDDIFGH